MNLKGKKVSVNKHPEFLIKYLPAPYNLTLDLPSSNTRPHSATAGTQRRNNQLVLNNTYQQKCGEQTLCVHSFPGKGHHTHQVPMFLHHTNCHQTTKTLQHPSYPRLEAGISALSPQVYTLLIMRHSGTSCARLSCSS